MLKLISNETCLEGDINHHNADSEYIVIYPQYDKEIKTVLSGMFPVRAKILNDGYEFVFGTSEIPWSFWQLWRYNKDYLKSLGFKVAKAENDDKKWLLYFFGEHYDYEHWKKTTDETLKAKELAKQEKYDELILQAKKGHHPNDP
jgi:hypothetical protein